MGVGGSSEASSEEVEVWLSGIEGVMLLRGAGIVSLVRSTNDDGRCEVVG